MSRVPELLKSYLRNASLVVLRKARYVMEVFEGLRQRKGGINVEKDAKKEKEDRRSDKKNSAAATSRVGTVEHCVEAGTYWLTRIVFLRSLGVIYCKLLKRSHKRKFHFSFV